MRVSPFVVTAAFFVGQATVAYTLFGPVVAGLVLMIVSTLIAYVSVAGGQR